MDLKVVTKRHFNEPWDNFDEPSAPGIRDLQRAVAGIRLHHGQPVFLLTWLAGVKVMRVGKMRWANTIQRIRVEKAPVRCEITGLWLRSYEMVDIRIPRWGIRQLIPRERGGEASHNAGRYLWHDPKTGEKLHVPIDLLGEYPEHGLYLELPLPSLGIIARHDPDGQCCYERAIQAQNCYGYYRPPNNDDVRVLREKFAGFLRAVPERLAGEAPAESEQAAIAREITELNNANDAAFWNDQKERTRENIIRPFAGNFVTVPGSRPEAPS